MDNSIANNGNESRSGSGIGIGIDSTSNNISDLNSSKQLTTENSDVINTDDCVNLTPKNNSDENKYILNPDYHPNLKHPENEQYSDNIEINDDKEASWIPSILKGENWPNDNDNNDTSNITNTTNNDNPLLSLSDKNTVLWQNNTEARKNANWRKFKDSCTQNEKFINNSKLKKISNTDSVTVPNTFAKKFKNRINIEDFKNSPASPLRLFEISVNENNNEKKVVQNNENYKNEVVNKIINHLSPKKLDMFRKSQDYYNTNSNNLVDDQSDKNLTSDAEEFSTFPDPQKFVEDGNQILQNMRKQSLLNLNNNNNNKNNNNNDDANNNANNSANDVNNEATSSNNNNNVSISDYTSTDEFTNSDADNTNLNNNTTNAKENEPKNEHESEPGNLKTNQLTDKDSIGDIRKKLNSRAEIYNSEFNVKEPKLQSDFSLSKHKGLNFIPASEYKNKIFDKKLGTYVLKSEYIENHNDKYNEYTEDNESTDPFDLSNLDPDKTNNSILKTKISKSVFNTVSDDFQNEISDDEYNELTITDSILVEAINETYPIEDWKLIEELDLSGFSLDNLFHLNKMTPNLWYLNASNNNINQNFGIPNEVQVLNLAFNLFDNISCKFNNFKNLQILNLSNNNIKDLRSLKDLKNLTSLDLSFNKINDLKYLENFKMLRYLNLSNNLINDKIDFKKYKFWFLEDLILNDNKIKELLNVNHLSQLINLSANNNEIVLFENDHINENLKRISLSNNFIKGYIDFTKTPNLKIIELDKIEVDNILQLNKQVNKLSIRFIKDENIMNDILKYCLLNDNLNKLYLTGGRIPKVLNVGKNNNFFSKVKVLDLSAMNLTEIPKNFCEFFPFLIDLNLNFNKLSSLKRLNNLKYLKQIKLVGNKINKLEDVLNFISIELRDTIRLIDLRVNPLTKGFYPTVFYEVKEGEDEEKIREIEENIELQEDADIEAFSVEYSKLYEINGLNEWNYKTASHVHTVAPATSRDRALYVAQIRNFFRRVAYLDGEKIS